MECAPISVWHLEPGGNWGVFCWCGGGFGEPRSGFAHAFGGFGRAAGVDFLFDHGADFGVDVFPVLEGAGEDGFADAAKETAGDLFDESGALGVIEDFADENSGLGEVVILGA